MTQPMPIMQRGMTHGGPCHGPCLQHHQPRRDGEKESVEVKEQE